MVQQVESPLALVPMDRTSSMMVVAECDCGGGLEIV